MKKIILSTICIASSFLLIGCGGVSDTEANKALTNQLNRVENVLSSSSVESINEITPADFINNEKGTKLIDQKNLSLYSSQSEKNLKESILNKTSQIKNFNLNSIKLGNDKASAIKNLSQNISKYLTYLNNSKNDLKNSVNNIKSKDKISNTNVEETNSNYVILNSNMREREIYLENLLESLEQVEEIYQSSQSLVNENSNQTNNNKNSDNSKITEETYYNGYNYNTNLRRSRFAPNIDTYRNNYYSNYNLYPQEPINPNYSNSSYYGINSNNYNRAVNGYGYYNNGYGINNQTLNPNRNTDTYAPINKNIDTYQNNAYENQQIKNQNSVRQENLSVSEEEEKDTKKDNLQAYSKKSLNEQNLQNENNTSKKYHIKNNSQKFNNDKLNKKIKNKSLKTKIYDENKQVMAIFNQSKDNKIKSYTRELSAPKILGSERNKGSKII